MRTKSAPHTRIKELKISMPWVVLWVEHLRHYFRLICHNFARTRHGFSPPYESSSRGHHLLTTVPVVVVGDSGSLAGGSPTYLQRRCAGSPPPSLGLVARPGVALARHQVPQALECHAARLRHAPGSGSGSGEGEGSGSGSGRYGLGLGLGLRLGTGLACVEVVRSSVCMTRSCSRGNSLNQLSRFSA